MNGIESFLCEVLGSEVFQRLGWALVHLLWQGVAVAALAAGGMYLLRRRSANARYAMACVALAVLAALPVATAWLAPVIDDANVEEEPTAVAALPADASPAQLPPAGGFAPLTDLDAATVGLATPDDASDLEGEAPRPAAALPPVPWPQRAVEAAQPMLGYVVALWLAGVLSLSLWRAAGWARVRQLRASGTCGVDDSVARMLTFLVRRLTVTRPVRAARSAMASVPMVIGHLRPVILLPACALTGLTGDQLRAVLAHELAHIRRHDFLFNLIQTIIETLLFYHPAVWWLSARIRTERENCCDDLAAAVAGDRVDYARALARLAELQIAQPRLAVAATGGSLLARIRRLLVAPADGPSRGSRWLAGLLTIATIAALAVLIPLACNSASSEGQTPADNETATQPGSQPAFGPVIERVLPRRYDTAGMYFIDLESGQVLNPPPEVTEKTFPAWAKKTGADAGCGVSFASGGEYLDGFDCCFKAAPAGSFADLTPEQVVSELDGVRPVKEQSVALDRDVKLPPTFCFKTREGGMGLLQVIGFTDEPRGIRIRYKMLRNGPVPSQPAATTQDAGAAVEDVEARAIRDQLAENWANEMDLELRHRIAVMKDGKDSAPAKELAIERGATSIQHERLAIRLRRLLPGKAGRSAVQVVETDVTQAQLAKTWGREMDLELQYRIVLRKDGDDSASALKLSIEQAVTWMQRERLAERLRELLPGKVGQLAVQAVETEVTQAQLAKDWAKVMDLESQRRIAVGKYGEDSAPVRELDIEWIETSMQHERLAMRLRELLPGKAGDAALPLPSALPSAQPAREIDAATQRSVEVDYEALRGKLINWVEDFFSKNYRDITARKTLQWGRPETTPGGNLSIRYKYVATIWGKDKLVIEQRFTFTPQGKYVSAETLEKAPAPTTQTDPRPTTQPATQPAGPVGTNADWNELADMLAAELGGKWQVDSHNAFPEFLKIIRGRTYSEQGKSKARYNIFPFGAAAFRLVPFGSQIDADRVLGANEWLTVTKWTKDTSSDTSVEDMKLVNTLGLKPRDALVSMPASQTAREQLRRMMQQIRIVDDPEAAIRASLPTDGDDRFVIQRVKPGSPWHREPGRGVAYYIGRPLESMDRSRVKQEYSLVLWIMPPEYAGSPQRRDSPSPVGMPELILSAPNGKVYSSYGANKQALGLLDAIAPLPGQIQTRRDELLAEADKSIRQGLVKLADTFPQLRQARYWEQLKDLSPRKRLTVGLYASPRRTEGDETTTARVEDTFNFGLSLRPASIEHPREGAYPVLPNLRIVGFSRIMASDEKLQAALSELVDEAFAPLLQLNDALAPQLDDPLPAQVATQASSQPAEADAPSRDVLIDRAEALVDVFAGALWPAYGQPKSLTVPPETPGPVPARLPGDVMAYIVESHMQAHAKARAARLPVNTHIYGVDGGANMCFGGLLTYTNASGKPEAGPVHLGNFGKKKPDYILVDETGRPQRYELRKRHEAKVGLWGLWWMPKKPVDAGALRLLGYIRGETVPLQQADGLAALTMDNHYGSRVLENFFLVVPRGTPIARASAKASSMRTIGQFDIHLWQRVVPRNTRNSVSVDLALATQATLNNSIKAQIEQDIRRAILEKLNRASARCRELFILVADDFRTAECTIEGLEELRGESGQNVWRPIEGSLRIWRVGSSLWKVQGRRHLGYIDFLVNTPAQPATQPAGHAETSS